MPGLNQYVKPLQSITLTSDDSPQDIDLIPDVLTTGIEVQIDADVTISGGSTSGTLLTETPHGLVEWMMAEHDGFEWLKRIPPREVAMLQRLIHGSAPRFTTFADGDEAANIALQAAYMIPCSNPLLINPFETVGYFPPADLTFKLWLKRPSTINYGTFFSGGDRTLTVNSIVATIYQHFAKGPLSYRPTLLPQYSYDDSDAISASVSNFPFDVRTEPGERLVLLLQKHMRDGVGVSDLVNYVTFETARNKIVDVVPPSVLQRLAARFYPGIDASAGNTEASTHQAYPVGYVPFNFVTDHVGGRWGGGKLRMAVDAARLQGYQMTLDVTRTSGTERIRHLKVMGRSWDGWTKL